MNKTIIVVIPARMASTRFPDKPLTKILDLPMIEHIRRRALLAENVADVVVATCDQEIVDVVTAAGGKAVMTASTHSRANDRVAEAARLLDADIIVVVQGDEPAVLPESLSQVAAPLLENDHIQCSVLLSPLDAADYQNVNIVKAACDQLGRIIFLSRSPIPYQQVKGVTCPVYRETGIRAFRADFMQIYSALPETPFEQTESVDMLRVLEHGYPIQGVPVSYISLGVDHPDDVLLVERLMKTDETQRMLYQRTIQWGV